VRPTEQIEPVPEWVAAYRERLDLYRALYPALRAVTD
jgi:sugar (pentulose or hexulose) kinase